MNVLPLVLLLILVLSAFTVRQLENFKNSEILKKEYIDFIRYQEGKDLEERQRRLYKSDGFSKKRKLNFRPFFDKTARSTISPDKMNQLRQVVKELTQVLYAEAEFFKKIREKRPNFVDEILDEIIKISDEKVKAFEGRIENLATVKLSDPELQEAFYYMLKGSMENRSTIDIEEYKSINLKYREKTYPSLLDFLRDQKMPNRSPETIVVYSAPPEIIYAIYGKEIGTQVISKIEELKNSSSNQVEKNREFELFMKNQPKNPGIHHIFEFSVDDKDDESPDQQPQPQQPQQPQLKEKKPS
jgi:hypothetical protein